MAHESNTDMDTAAHSYITELATKAAGTKDSDSWYCVAACAFAASNQGQYVADVYRQCISQYREDDYEQQKRILRRIKESILKTGIIYGIPRVINAFRSLIKALPGPESNEIESTRSHVTKPADLDQRGIEYMHNIFRADLDPFLQTMDKYWPDLRTLVVTFIYGYYQSDLSVIDSITTSQLNIATLVPMDVTAEVAWHMRGLIRNGGTRGQLNFAFDTTMEICRITDVRLKNRMPDPENVINEERLF